MRLRKTECHKGLNLKLVARYRINSNPNSRFATNMEENYPFKTVQVFHIFKNIFKNLLNLLRNKKWVREGCQCDSRPLKEIRPHVDVDVAAAKEKFQKTKLKLVHKNWMTKTHSLMLDSFWPLRIVSNLNVLRFVYRHLIFILAKFVF